MQDDLVHQTTQGSYAPHGRDDILTTAIGRPEHPGRVRATGGSWGLRDYFGPPPSRTSGDSPSEEVLARLRTEMETQLQSQLQEQMDRMRQEFQSQFQQQFASFTQQQTVHADDVARVSTKGSCSVAEASDHSHTFDAHRYFNIKFNYN